MDSYNSTLANGTVEEHCDGVLNLQFAAEDTITRHLYSTPEKLIILTLYPISLLIGLTGNFAFLAVVAFVPEMRTITNAYLGNLAVADILFLSALNYDVLMGYILSPIVKMKPYFSSFGCGFRICIQFTSHVTIVGLILLVTVERYLGICKPFKHRIVVAKGRTVKLILGAWSVGLMFSALVIPNVAIFTKTCVIWPTTRKYDTFPGILRSCNPVIPVFGMFHDILLIPLLIVLLTTMIMYTRIIRNLNKRVSEVAGTGVTDARQVRNQVARLLIATGTFFFFCCVPEFTLHFNKLILTVSNGDVGFKMTPKQQWYVVWLARGMTTNSAVVNPIIYGLTNKRYRDAFKKLITGKWMKRKMAANLGSGLNQVTVSSKVNQSGSSTANINSQSNQ
ncbi:thyrotropin-releasing hormone receptor-like [Amphiura filiformis]|uniref:thyrotropin-releasing hormone receptor-like n=1 Tax=Amphiura filiformis TaxID=82378 RepID=UPI003B20D058